VDEFSNGGTRTPAERTCVCPKVFGGVDSRGFEFGEIIGGLKHGFLV
jgi:hypothetical protein